MNPVQHLVVAGVRFYRWVLSPAKTVLLGPLGRCRYQPTCSAYALEAVRLHGACRGLWLAVRRLCRCHPWGGCGDDPVPPAGVAPVEARELHGDAPPTRRPFGDLAQASPPQGPA